MKVTLASSFAVFATVLTTVPSLAEEDCINDITGRRVCGADAEAVRVRLRFEQQMQFLEQEEEIALQKTSELASTEIADALLGDNVLSDDALSDDALNIGQEPEPESQIYADASAQSQPETRGRYNTSEVKGASVYQSFRRRAFVRGGYMFAGHGNAPQEQNGFIGSVGYSNAFNRGNLRYETELVYLNDSDEFDVLGVPVETTIWSLTALIGPRMEFPIDDVFTPFVSVAAGPAFLRARVETGGTESWTNDLKLGYSSRVGMRASFSDDWSVEAAYRYIGATINGTIGYHSAEVGLNYDF